MAHWITNGDVRVIVALLLMVQRARRIEVGLHGRAEHVHKVAGVIGAVVMAIAASTIISGVVDAIAAALRHEATRVFWCSRLAAWCLRLMADCLWVATRRCGW